MRVHVIGAGPAGLYFSTLMKRSFSGAEVEVYERRQRGSTFGFGIVFSDRALDFLISDDPATHKALAPALERWSDLTVVHRGERVVIDGIGFAAIARRVLLDLLEARAMEAGVRIHYGIDALSIPAPAEADLVVAADGVNSNLRQQSSEAFGTTRHELNNRFIWFGTSKPFETLTQTFIMTGYGAFNAHHYRYASDASTFIVETDAQTFSNAGLAKMASGDALRFCETLFAETLEGAPLISNESHWRRFPVVRNRTWSAGKRVLLGDALHSAHFSIGSGTRLALEDAIALVRAIEMHPGDLPLALKTYQEARAPVLAKLLQAADASAAWYESFQVHMTLAPYEFAMSYINRSGRIDRQRLKEISPDFVARYEASAA